MHDIIKASKILNRTRRSITMCKTTVWSSIILFLTQSGQVFDLVVPRTRRQIGDRAFSVAAPRAWNREQATEGTRYRRSWNCCDRRTRFVVIWKHFCFILSTGTKIRIDSVMRSRSSSRGRNTSASVTVTVTVSST